MNFGASIHPPVAASAEWSVEASYPSIICDDYTAPAVNNKNTIYEFKFEDGNVVVSYGMMIRLCQEGHIFKMLLFGGNGFKSEKFSSNIGISTLQYYGITKAAFQALVLSLRTNNPSIAYTHKFMYESIGGFKTIDKHHIKRMKKKDDMKKKKEKSEVCPLPNDLHTTNRTTNRTTYSTTINLISEDEDDRPV